MLKMPPILFALGLLLLLTTPAPTSGLCTLQHNDTLAQCRYLDDIKFINTDQLKSLKVTSVGKHLSASIFGNITTLQHLDLSHGKLRRIEPGTFSKLRNLLSLDLSHNRLTHLGRGTFEGPTHLGVLNLRSNSLLRIPVDTVDLKDLKLLEISSNKLNCDCKTLKIRDALIFQRVIISKKAVCAGPGTLKGVFLSEPETEVICKFEHQDQDAGMQNDQPETPPEGSGESGSGDAFDHLEDSDIPEESDTSFLPEPVTPQEPEETTPNAIEAALTVAPSTSSAKDEGLFFTEEEKHPSTIPSPTAPTTTAANDSDPWKSPNVLSEGSGDDEDDGSGLGSPGLLIPPITWDNITPEVPEEETPESIKNVTPNPTTTTTPPGLFNGFFGLFSWGASESTTAAPSTPSTEDSRPEEEGFMVVPGGSKPEIEEPILPNSLNPVEGEKKPNEAMNEKVQQESKPVESPEEPSVVIGGTQTAGASATTETKKGMGSYVVLGVLLGVLAALIGVAAYKGDFCRKARKRNSRGHDGNDVENGTELKDLRMSLLEATNSVQPKISSNGSKPEAMPLVTSAIPEEIRSDEEPTAKFVGSVPESSADPVKPPRKSFSPAEAEKLGTNGKVPSTEDVGDGPITPVHGDHLVNGKNDRDSMCSVGESPSLGSVSNHRLSNPSPSSPAAQRVKITMQDNPDSVPKTPLLITRTRAGENLVKTP
ncbi:protein windpipe [Diachasma alloeum]|uniref:protein windpipe n=1 Tax=Diachasma alloeum TaxID=454923 RepID=UPI0007382FD5|nr:protein windpipe [Diachasma alloeum]XP_015111703.1 protein windpipe [Diachasma alloeum]